MSLTYRVTISSVCRLKNEERSSSEIQISKMVTVKLDNELIELIEDAGNCEIT